MIDQTPTRIVVQRKVDVAAAAMFAVVADPARHTEIDGSQTVQGGTGAPVITGIGQVFTMEMSAPDLGNYRTENHVTEFEPGRRITWQTTRNGNPPPGFYWSWIFEPLAASRSRVVHVYDWEQVVDRAILARVEFPRVAPADMLTSIDLLAEVSSRPQT